jgi:CRP-like cAMP-binding protein
MGELSGAVRHRANRLLAALDSDDFARLAPHLSLIELSSGSILYESGDRIENIYFPHDSVISLVAVMAHGGLVEMAVFGREGVVGFASSLVTRESFGRYVVQIGGSASRIGITQVQDALHASPSTRDLLFRYIQALLAQTFQTVACNASHSVEARCCEWILKTHDRVGRCDLPLTHEFMAEMLGVQRPTVSVALRALQNAGLIGQRRGLITVTDRLGLESSACECYGTIRRNFERLLPMTYEDRPTPRPAQHPEEQEAGRR